MRLIAATAPRQALYDRNAASGASSNTTTSSESEADTQVWAYTVPTDKKAQVSNGSLEILCDVPATTANTGYHIVARILITPSGGSQTIINEVLLSSAAMAAGDHVELGFGQGPVLMEGDLIEGRRFFDGSAGGAGRARISISHSRTEFDA